LQSGDTFRLPCAVVLVIDNSCYMIAKRLRIKNRNLFEMSEFDVPLKEIIHLNRLVGSWNKVNYTRSVDVGRFIESFHIIRKNMLSNYHRRS